MLNNAVIGAGEAYEEIARITDEQAKKDWEPLGDMMHDYKGLLAGWPNVLSIHSVSWSGFEISSVFLNIRWITIFLLKDSVKKRKECERKDQEGTLGADMGQIRGRADVMSYAMLAEINTFHNNRAGDIKQASQRFLQEQIEYYQQVTWYT